MLSTFANMLLSLPPIADTLKAMKEVVMEDKSVKVRIPREQNLSKNRRVMSDKSER